MTKKEPNKNNDLAQYLEFYLNTKLYAYWHWISTSFVFQNFALDHLWTN